MYDALDSRRSDQFIKTTCKISKNESRTYNYGGDIRDTVATLSTPTIVPPADYGPDATRTEISIWEKVLNEPVGHISDSQRTPTLCTPSFGDNAVMMSDRRLNLTTAMKKLHAPPVTDLTC